MTSAVEAAGVLAARQRRGELWRYGLVLMIVALVAESLLGRV